MHLIVNAVLLSLVLGVELASKIPIAAVRDCSARGFPRVRLETAPLRNRTHIALADLLDAVVSRNPAGVDHTSDVGALLDGRCVSVGASFHGPAGFVPAGPLLFLGALGTSRNGRPAFRLRCF